MWVWLYRNSAPLSSYFSDIPPVYTEYSAISKKQEIRSLRNDLLLHMALYSLATVYKGNIIKNLIMDCQSYTKYRPNETTGGIFVSWRRKEELPTGA